MYSKQSAMSNSRVLVFMSRIIRECGDFDSNSCRRETNFNSLKIQSSKLLHHTIMHLSTSIFCTRLLIPNGTASVVGFYLNPNSFSHLLSGVKNQRIIKEPRITVVISVKLVGFAVVLNYIHELAEAIESFLIHLRIHEAVVELKCISCTGFRLSKDTS